MEKKCHKCQSQISNELYELQKLRCLAEKKNIDINDWKNDKKGFCDWCMKNWREILVDVGL